MTRLAGVLAFVFLAAGCATDASVKKQIDPLADRISALEHQQAGINSKLDAQNAELQGLRKDVGDANAAAARAQEAANQASAAAARAETAADKASKAFELSQVKGARK